MYNKKSDKHRWSRDNLIMGKYQYFILYYSVEEQVAPSEKLHVLVTLLNYC